MRYFSLCCLVGLSVFATSPARDDDGEKVKQKLFEAKKAFDAEAKKFQKAITDSLDKREEDARTSGNKKVVDLVKAERAAFEKSGEHPSVMPPGLVNQMAINRANLDTAYAAAIKDFLKLKMDDAAASAEKEQQEFRFNAAVLYGKRTFVSSFKATDIKALNNSFNKETKAALIDGQLVPHSLFMHPPDNRSFASASFALLGKPLAFRAIVGIPKHAENNGDPASALTFEVLGDGNSLWKSELVSKLNTFQTCAVRIEKVKTLTLRVHCSDGNGWAHGVWFAPVIVE